LEPSQQSNRLVFIHIGKTAGTSLRHILTDAFGPGACSEPFVQSYMSAGEARHYASFKAVCGHISRADQLRWFPDRKVITVLRDPIDRCLSFIHYVRSLPPESAQVAADSQTMPLLDFVETQEAQRNMHNTMVRQLGGHMLDEPNDFPALLESARRTLKEALWVGRQDAIEEDLSKLAEILRVQLEMRRENVTPTRPSHEDEDPRLLNRLYELNGYDLQLWQWARKALF
jgi:hypothetical protein